MLAYKPAIVCKSMCQNSSVALVQGLRRKCGISLYGDLSTLSLICEVTVHGHVKECGFREHMAFFKDPFSLRSSGSCIKTECGAHHCFDFSSRNS